MTQRSLFDTTPLPTGIYGQPIEQPLARKSDPETSHKAAAKTKVKLVGLHKIFFDTLAKARFPQTAQEVAAEAVLIDGSIPVQAAISKRESIRKRAKELVARGWIREAYSRVCQVTGNESMTYEVVK